MQVGEGQGRGMQGMRVYVSVCVCVCVRAHMHRRARRSVYWGIGGGAGVYPQYSMVCAREGGGRYSLAKGTFKSVNVTELWSRWWPVCVSVRCIDCGEV